MDKKLGWESHGIPAGKRDLREGRPNGKQEYFRDPLKLLLYVLMIIFHLVSSPFMYFIKKINRKPKSLRGKVCFVTGSGRGLGRGICIALAKEGAIIACADIHEENNNKTVQILTEMGAKAKAYKLNVADRDQVQAVAESVEADLGRVYLLVNNAAIVMIPPEVTEEYTRATFGVNILGPIWTIMAFLPKMKEANEGHILNVSSIAANYGMPHGTMYGATKAALTNYSQGLRIELRLQGYNIFVTTVHPGVINTSADYIDSLNTRFGYKEVEEVTGWIIKCIKYNKTDVSNYPIIGFISSLGRYFPANVIYYFMKFMDITLIVPTAEEYTQLKLYDSIKQSSIIKQEKKAVMTDVLKY